MKKTNKLATIYKPANQSMVAFIEAMYKGMDLKDSEGRRISLGKFILLSAVRDMERTHQLAMAAYEAKEKGNEKETEGSDS